MYSWAREFKVWANREAKVILKMTDDFSDERTVIVNYEKLATTTKHVGLDSALIKQNFDWLIIDEAHKIKNRNAALSKSVIRLAHKIPNRLAITGTPAHDKPEDVFNILRFIDFKTFTSYWKFVSDWCAVQEIWTPRGPVKKPIGINPKLKDRFANLLASKYGIMRKREEVMDWDTAQDIIDIPLPLSNAQSKYLNELSKYFETSDGSEEVITQGVLDRIVRYRQICNAPAILKLSGNSPKIDWIIRYLKDYPDNSVLIFSNSRKFLDILAKKLTVTFCRIDGTISKKSRQDAVDKFQSNQVRVLLLQTQAGKEGLTLDTADATIFCDVFPPSSDYLQAKDRAVASTEVMVKPKTVFRLMMQDSYDQELYNLVDSNIERSSIINNFIKYIKRKE